MPITVTISYWQPQENTNLPMVLATKTVNISRYRDGAPAPDNPLGRDHVYVVEAPNERAAKLEPWFFHHREYRNLYALAMEALQALAEANGDLRILDNTPEANTQRREQHEERRAADAWWQGHTRKIIQNLPDPEAAREAVDRMLAELPPTTPTPTPTDGDGDGDNEEKN